jgi:prepilin-type N-terminal cleavage/methylation domain-containing protein
VIIKAERGFSLVEAIVALVVLSLVYSAVWGWFGTAARSTSRIERALALPEVFSQFTVHLELESLRDTTNGVYAIGEYQVQWQAVEQKTSSQQDYRRQPAWIVALYSIEAQVTRQGQAVSAFNTQLVQQWRDPDYVSFGG